MDGIGRAVHEPPLRVIWTDREPLAKRPDGWVGRFTKRPDGWAGQVAKRPDGWAGRFSRG
jgi:hypothetical protein